MRRFPRPVRSASLALVLGGALAFAPLPAASEPARSGEQPGSGDVAQHASSGRLLVRFRTPASSRAAHAAAGGRSLRRLAALRTDVVQVGDVRAAMAAYRSRADVESVEVDGRVHATNHVPDNAFPLQWNLKEPSTDPGGANWHPIYRNGLGDGVVVAIVDTGIGRGGVGGYDGFEHSLLPGIDLVTRGTPPDDDNGHGTHIAGTIAQFTGNVATGEPRLHASVAGVAPDARLMPVRVLDDEGSGSVSDTAEGVVWAVDRGAKIVNLSLAGDYSKTLCDAVTYATSRGVLLVAAAGNESGAGLLPVAYPAACPGAVAVGGHRWDAARAAYSNGSCELAITGPGGDLSAEGRVGNPQDPRNGVFQESWDPLRAEYAFFYDSGTSMSAAHVAGAAAILMGPPHNKPAGEVVTLLRATAREAGVGGPDVEHGNGALDIANAVRAASAGSKPAPAERLGYWMVASDGGLFSFGDAPFHGSAGGTRINSPIVGMARTPTGRGYWMAAADGGVFAYGDATFYGSAGSLPLKAPIVGIAPFPNGRGYWLVASDGGIFTYQHADEPSRFYGSTGAMPLNKPIVGMAGTRTGDGYWLVASDGGIFSFGDAFFHGSTGAMPLNKPIVAISRTPTGAGYWMVATDGGIFSFGDAAFHGSTGAMPLNKPIVGMVPTCFGRGYWLVASDGGIFSFGAAPFLGSTGGTPLNKPIVGITLAADHRAAQL
ncbi:MAG TPA: S8 family serine peptidase [Acidimicrobiales bacterium]